MTKLSLAAALAFALTLGADPNLAPAAGPGLEHAISRAQALVHEATEWAPAAAPPAAAPRVQMSAPVSVRLGRKLISIPQSCRDASGRYDLVVHFHGAPETTEPAFRKAGITATFVVVNLGVGSGPYEDAYMSDGSLARLLDEIDGVMQKHCPSADGGRGRLALSAWSAGYGAIYRVLASKNDRELVDAVLLADGMHAGFLDDYRQKMNTLQMAPFDGFAERAAKGEKLFAITHTAIVTPSYASTSETASYLVAARGLSRTALDEPGPRPKMRLTSRADRAGFHVLGYSGKDTDAHCDQLYAMGDTLFSTLKSRWSEH